MIRVTIKPFFNRYNPQAHWSKDYETMPTNHTLRKGLTADRADMVKGMEDQTIESTAANLFQRDEVIPTCFRVLEAGVAPQPVKGEIISRTIYKGAKIIGHITIEEN